MVAGAHYFFYAWELPIFVAMGCVGGATGALWIRCNVAMTRLRARWVPARLVKRRLAEVMCLCCHAGGAPRRVTGLL